MLRYVMPVAVAGALFVHAPERVVGSRFVEMSVDTIASAAHVRLENDSATAQHYMVSLRAPDVKMRSQPRWDVGAGKSRDVTLFVDAPRASFRDGRRTAYLYIDDSAGFHRVVAVTLYGPE